MRLVIQKHAMTDHAGSPERKTRIQIQHTISTRHFAAPRGNNNSMATSKAVRHLIKVQRDTRDQEIAHFSTELMALLPLTSASARADAFSSDPLLP